MEHFDFLIRPGGGDLSLSVSRLQLDLFLHRPGRLSRTLAGSGSLSAPGDISEEYLQDLGSRHERASRVRESNK